MHPFASGNRATEASLGQKSVDVPIAIPYHGRTFHQEWRRDWPDDATATGFAKCGTTRCQFQV